MVYLNRKPFVIRDAKFPLRNIDTYHGILTLRLEQMELRLKEDIIKEQHRWSGLVLVHEERSDSRIISNWMAIDHIQTPREVFESLKEEGFKVSYDRIPISPEQAPEDRYIDEFLQKFMGKSQSVRGPLIFNCGMGFGRTTCSMVIAMVIRRAQMLLNNDADPLPSTKKSIPESQLENEKMMDMIGLLEFGISLILFFSVFRRQKCWLCYRMGPTEVTSFGRLEGCNGRQV
jgi:Inositol hexakisphosphate